VTVFYLCRRCGIRVFGFKRDKLCSSCRCTVEGRWPPTRQDRTNDDEPERSA